MNPNNRISSRPLTPMESFEKAFEIAGLTEIEKEIIDYIRYIGTFTQISLVKSLSLKPSPPALSILCEACRKLGKHMPQHFAAVRKWSEEASEDGVRWDGNLICCTAWNVDGERLTPEAGTTQYHTFVVHKELFQGLDY